MTRKEFTLQFGAVLMLVHPDMKDKPELSIATAAKFYDLHANMMKAGAVKNKLTKDKKTSWYKALIEENTRWHDWFIAIRKAFNYGTDREKAAEQFLLICRSENPNDNDFKHWRYAADETAKERPFLDHTAKHFNMWLKDKDYSGRAPKTDKEVIQDKESEKRRELNADLNHFKGQLKHSPGNQFIEDEIKRLEGLLGKAT